jgi:hypothetical protein
LSLSPHAFVNAALQTLPRTIRPGSNVCTASIDNCFLLREFLATWSRVVGCSAGLFDFVPPPLCHRNSTHNDRGRARLFRKENSVKIRVNLRINLCRGCAQTRVLQLLHLRAQN